MTVNAVGDLTITARITYTGVLNTRTLTKTGPGLLTLSNSGTASNYRGGTTINEGNLLFATTASHPTTGTTLINAGGALVAGGAYTTVADWLNSSRGRINTGSSARWRWPPTIPRTSAWAAMPVCRSVTGNHTYSGTLTPANNTYRLGGGGGTITITNPLIDNGATSRSLVVGGNVTLTGANSYGGRTVVAAGNVELGASAQSPVLTGGGADIRTGKMIFDYIPGNDPAANIKAMLAASYSASRFASGQIYCSTATTSIGLGWLDNTTIHQVTVARTLYGDANLDGTVNVSDLAALAANYRKTVTGGWAAGDFNYDGVVNVSDLALLASNYRQTLGGPSLGDAEAMLGLPQSVPEPSRAHLTCNRRYERCCLASRTDTKGRMRLTSYDKYDGCCHDPTLSRYTSVDPHVLPVRTNVVYRLLA